MMTNQSCLDAGTGSAGLKKSDLSLLVPLSATVYRLPVAAKSATDLGGSDSRGATAPPLRLQALFLCPHFRVMAGCAGAPSGASGSFAPIRQSCATRHPYLLGGRKGWLQSKGATPMLTHLFSLTPSEIQSKIARHRARAIAQLKSKSSLRVRHERYNSEMARARFFEAMLAGGAK